MRTTRENCHKKAQKAQKGTRLVFVPIEPLCGLSRIRIGDDGHRKAQRAKERYRSGSEPTETHRGLIEIWRGDRGHEKTLKTQKRSRLVFVPYELFCGLTRICRVVGCSKETPNAQPLRRGLLGSCFALWPASTIL